MNIRPLFLPLALLLAACSHNPASYLPSGNTPIVNLEANLANALQIKAEAASLQLHNSTAQPLAFSYKLFWYDALGVSQPTPDGWQPLTLAPQAKAQLPLTPPTAESANYRVYLRANR